MFLNQDKALEYVRNTQTTSERLLLQAALNFGIANLLREEEMRIQVSEQPLDLLLYVKMLHPFFQQRELLEGILAERFESYEDACSASGLF